MNSPRLVTTITHWIGRLATIGLTGLFLQFLFGEGPPTLNDQPWDVVLLFVGWAAIFLGYVVGWVRPSWGGSLVLLALASMYAVQWFARGSLLGPWFLLWAVPGLIFLLAGWLKRRPADSPPPQVAALA